ARAPVGGDRDANGAVVIGGGVAGRVPRSHLYGGVDRAVGLGAARLDCERKGDGRARGRRAAPTTPARRVNQAVEVAGGALGDEGQNGEDAEGPHRQARRASGAPAYAAPAGANG